MLDSGSRVMAQSPSLQPAPARPATIDRIPIAPRKPLSPWLPLSVGGSFGLLFSGRVREWFLARRLRSKNIDIVLDAIRGLSLHPRQAHLLLQRWADEWQRVQCHDIDTKTTQPILKEIQKSVDRLQHHSSMQWGWQTVSWRDRWPNSFQRFYRLTSRWLTWDESSKTTWETGLTRWVKLPFRSIPGARLERRTLPLTLGPIRIRNAHLEKAQMQHVGLQGADLRGCCLEQADFSYALLERCSFYQTQADAVKMDHAELRLSTFVGSSLRRASFIHATLDDADFRHSDIRDAHFFQSSLARINGSHVQAVRCSFLFADLRESMWEGANLRESEMAQTWAKRSCFQSADLTRSNCPSSDLSSCDLHEADCSLLNAYEADLRWSNLSTIRWSGMCLMDANLMSANATTELLSYAEAQEALLDDEQMQRVLQWNEEHPDAPWLQDDWTFWWESIEWQNGIDWRDPNFHFEDHAYAIQCELHELQMYLHPTY